MFLVFICCFAGHAGGGGGVNVYLKLGAIQACIFCIDANFGVSSLYNYIMDGTDVPLSRITI